MIDIVIVNWNSGHLLLNCINSISAYRGDFVYQIIVVDNFSSDQSIDLVRDHCGIKFVMSQRNLGFGKACNLGAQYATSDMLLFLNPDAELFSDTLANAAPFTSDPIFKDIGVFGVQLIDGAGRVARSCARFPNVSGFIVGATKLDRFFPHLGHPMVEWDHANSRYVEQVIGAFFLVRRFLFAELNGFDEQFFVYFEEVDFSIRARAAGWKSFYIAGAQAFHFGGGTSNQVRARRLFYSLRSRLLYVFKHFNWIGVVLVLLTTLVVELFTRSAFAIVRRSWPNLKEVWSAYGMLVDWLLGWIFRGETT